MPKNPRIAARDSSDEDDLFTYWRTKSKYPSQPEDKDNEACIKESTANPLAFDAYQPFVYKRARSVQWNEDFELKMLTQSAMINLYWEGVEDNNLLETLHETCEDMKLITKSEGYILYLIDDVKNEIFFCSKTLKELTGKRYTWNIEVDKTIATFVAKNKKSVIKNDDSVDSRYPDGQDLGSFYASNILAVPVCNESVIVAVVELYRVNGEAYTEHDLQVVKYLMSLAGDVLVENREGVVKRKCDEVNDFLLFNLEKFTGITQKNEDYFTTDVLNSSVLILNCESVTFFSFSEGEKLRRIYTNQKNPVLNLSLDKKKLRIAKEADVANLIKNSKGIVNFADIFNDPRFDKDVDRRIGLLIRSVLGSVLCRNKSDCFGVVMAINKRSEEKFTPADERIFVTISKYLKIGLAFVEAFAEYDRQQRQHACLFDIYVRQLKSRVSIAETYNLQETIYIPTDFYQFNFIVDDSNFLEIPKYLFHMFNNAVSVYLPDKDQLYKLIFAAKKLYRENPFHNFHHAFKCFHTVFMIFRMHPEYFSPLEKYAMLVSVLLHDCEHLGLTGKYLELIDHPIIDKSETTPLEVHQYKLGKLVLKRIKILDHLSTNERGTFLSIFQDCIISSNTAVFMKRRAKLKPLIDSKILNWKNEEHRTMIRSVIAMSADLSIIAKPEEDVLESTRLLYTEFFKEADLLQEKNISAETVPSRKDKFNIPTNEIDFCVNFALPCLEILMELLPATAPLYYGAIKTEEMWKRMETEIKNAEETEEISEKIVSYLMSIG